MVQENGQALLTKTEIDWLSGNYLRPISKSYEYKMKSRIRNKLRIFQETELPLLFKSGRFPELADPNFNSIMKDIQGRESWTGFGDGSLL